MDVKTAFLNGRLDEDIYMEQLEGYVDPKYPNSVCKLQRAIYGLKQASHQWNKRFDEEIKRFRFIQNRDEPCVYRKASGSDVVFLILYVDDILIMGNNIPRLKEVKDYLGKCFSVKDLGDAAYILGIKIYRDRSLWTMATTIEQQVALDEALVPSAQREMLHISLRVSGQSFAELPFEEEILEFLRFLGHSTQIKTLTDVNVNKLYQPWRSFAAVINKYLTGKSTGFDSLRLSQAQILWGLYFNRNVDYSFLIWEDLVYQVEHKNQKKSNEMYYLRFTKVIIHHFMTKKPSIPRRNRVNWHYFRDDILFSTIKVVSRHQNTQQYGAILPIELITDNIRNTKAYKEYYACATGEAAPKPKASARKKRGCSASSTTPPTPIATPTPTTTVVVALRLFAAGKGKQPARATSPTDPSDVERTEAEQLKIVLRRSRHEMHISQQGGSDTDEETSSKPGVLDVPSDDSEEELSWNSSDDEDVDEQTKGRNESEGEKTDESNDDDDDD
nr:putative retrotransposon protein [Tanacetum cinerariifolium]